MTRPATNDPTCVLDADVRLRQPLHMLARRCTEFEYDQ
jgi:hypothetical protein